MAQQANQPLPPGFALEGYTIKRQLSLGGFSIVYLAQDPEGMLVAIKEYLPNSLALRTGISLTPVITPEHQNAFRYGLKCFFEEGRALAGMSHPNVIKVLNFFRANGTVYMVMDYVKGRTLHDFIHQHKTPVSERFIRGVFTRVLNGLREVHTNKLLHLDLKPSNIYLRANNSPVLIDFGAARQTLFSDTPMLKPMYTPGFASPEHYQSREHLGPWSDIYSIGASMYACMAKRTPMAANERMENDTLVPATKRFAGRYSVQLLDIVDWCMELDHLQRPQSCYALQKALVEEYDAPEPIAPVSEKGSWLGNIVNKLKKTNSKT